MTQIPPKVKYINSMGHKGRALDYVFELDKEPTTSKEKFIEKFWQTRISDVENYKEMLEEMYDFDEEGAIEEFLKQIETYEKIKFTDTCGQCGEETTYIREGVTLKAQNTCCYPGGHPSYDVLLNVPSGEIIFANDLRSLTQTEDTFYTESTIGLVKETQAYAKEGMIHIYVGNTCPKVCKTLEEIQIINLNEDTDPTRILYDIQGFICTDIGWYCAMDKNLFLERCQEENLNPEEFDPLYVSVDPGVYSFSDELRKQTPTDDILYSRIQKSNCNAPVIHKMDTGPAPSFEESLAKTVLDKLISLKFLGNTYTNVLTELTDVSGTGYKWHKSNLKKLSRRKGDIPFETDSEIIGNTDFIPTATFNSKMWGNENDSIFAEAPESIDIYWLAIGLIYYKSRIDIPFTIEKNSKDEEAVQEKTSQRIKDVTSIFNKLYQIAHKRNLVQDGTLSKVFENLNSYFDFR
jgi:hypothetical protein